MTVMAKLMKKMKSDQNGYPDSGVIIPELQIVIQLSGLAPVLATINMTIKEIFYLIPTMMVFTEEQMIST